MRWSAGFGLPRRFIMVLKQPPETRRAMTARAVEDAP
jgi:hypothetical protein